MIALFPKQINLKFSTYISHLAASFLCSMTASGCSTWTLFRILPLTSFTSARALREESEEPERRWMLANRVRNLEKMFLNGF